MSDIVCCLFFISVFPGRLHRPSEVNIVDPAVDDTDEEVNPEEKDEEIDDEEDDEEEWTDEKGNLKVEKDNGSDGEGM